MKDLSKSSSLPPTKRLARLPVWLGLTALLFLGMLLSLCAGTASVGPGDVVRVILQGERGTLAARIILYARMPRMFGAILAGAALATAGAVIQTVLSNPLASPNIIGVNAGAGTGVVLASVLFPAWGGAVPVMAFAGAMLSVGIILLLSERAGGSKVTIILAGVALSSFLSAVIDAVLTLVPESLNGYTDFKIGGLAGLSMGRLQPAAVLIGIVLLLTLGMAQNLEILSLGEELAHSLGLHTRRTRLLSLTLAAALTGTVVSFSGLIGFVGLLTPHMVRRLLGEETMSLLLGSALGGAVLVLLCDFAARTVFAPYELPVGVVLAFFGAPFFLWQLFYSRKERA